MIDTLATVEDLQKAGFSEAQARGLAHTLVTTTEPNDKIDTRMGSVELRMVSLEGKVNLIQWMMGLSIGLSTAILLKLLFTH